MLVCLSGVNMLNCNPHCNEMYRWCLWEMIDQEHGALVNGMSAIRKEKKDIIFFSSSQQKMNLGIYKPIREP